MNFSGLLVQLFNGLASASSLFLVAAGLSLIFGVTRIVNFAHGSFYMLGIYIAHSVVERLGANLGFWPGILVAALVVGALGALVEVLLLRRIYKAPELFQLLATFALVLVIKDAALWIWGADDLIGPRAPGLSGAVRILGQAFPSYDLFLIGVGPAVLGATWLLLTQTRFGSLVRAATQDRDMVSALGVNQAWLFTAVFSLGTFLGGLGGALQLPKEAATLDLDIHMIGAAFVVVVVGGMGSLPGAYLAALLIAEVKAVCIWLGVVDVMGMSISFSKLTLVVEFLVMALVLIRRPWGLLGRPQAPSRHLGQHEEPIRAGGRAFGIAVFASLAALVVLPFAAGGQSYAVVLAIDLMIATLFAASLHFIMGPAGMHSFGHAAYFGLGAYGAALLAREGGRLFGLPMEAALLLAPLVAGAGALLFGWFVVRLSGVYLAMLTLAFAQITWAITFQWDSFTGGSNGMSGVWPSPWLADKRVYYGLTLFLVFLALWLLRRIMFSPFGYALRAGRDSPLRADAIGIDLKRLQWIAFAIAGTAAGLAGALFAFSKGSISPEALSATRSVDGLVMVLLGGLQTLSGPVVGAVAFNWLHDTAIRNTEYWRTVIGGTILLLVLLFPQGIVGGFRQLVERWSGLRRRFPPVKAGDNTAEKTRVGGVVG